MTHADPLSNPAPLIVALGEAMVEFNQRDAASPRSYLQGFGGDTSNMVIAAARQGARAAYLSRVGADHFGDLLLALWQRESVDTRGVERDAQAATGVYFVTHGRDGHDFSYLRAGSAASRMAPGSPALDVLDGAAFLHLSGISQAISAPACDAGFAAIEHAHARGVGVSYDPNLRLKLWPLSRARAVIRETIGLADWFLPSQDDLRALSGCEGIEDQLDWCRRSGARAVVVKCGPQGCVLWHEGERSDLEGVPAKLVDATGAGDCFDGAFIARLAHGDAPVQAARYANVAASLSVQGFGAIDPIPTRLQVLEALGSLRG